MSSIIHVDGSETQVEPENGSTFSLRELQTAVGGYVEQLTLCSGQHLYVNEDGKSLNLPRNERATLLARAAGIAPNDYVVGDVIVVDLKHVDFGD